jgi:hypothetical protein
MSTLLLELRGMTNSSTSDYTIGTVSYWSDDHLQTVLDRNRVDLYRSDTEPISSYNNGTVEYKLYNIGYGHLEQGTDYFEIENSAGTTVGTANYTPDYNTGLVTFTADQGGTAYLFTGRSYDIYKAAAEIWRQKGAYFATQFDISSDNHSMRRSQIMKQCIDMASFYEAKATTGGNTELVRSDTT